MQLNEGLVPYVGFLAYVLDSGEPSGGGAALSLGAVHVAGEARGLGFMQGLGFSAAEGFSAYVCSVTASPGGGAAE